jgi:serine/threonine protein phosphatase PrpC
MDDQDVGGSAGDAKEADGVCPVCRAPVFAENNFCEACGHRIAAAAPARKVPDERPGGGTATGETPLAEIPAAGACTGCGSAAIDVDGYCERCGLRRPSGRDHLELELAGPDGGVIAAGVSDKGLRHSKNEDAMAVAAARGGVAAVVCDGVSSSPRPQDASRVAADTGVAVLLKELESGADAETASRTAVRHAAQAVAALAASEYEAPACTYVSALTEGASVTVGWVGDSRAYWLPAPRTGTPTDPGRPVHSGDGTRLTEDDSWAEQMVALGALSEAEAQAHRNAHVLVGWLGADAEAVEAHVRTFTPEGPGVVVVCSDGLWNYLPEAAAIAGALAEALPESPGGAGAGVGAGVGAAGPLTAARSLVGVALDSGGRDNVTVVVLPFLPADPVGPVESPAQPSTEPAE